MLYHSMAAAPSPRAFPQKLSFMGRALRHRNYRLFFSGQIISLMGTWLTTVATSWLVYQLSRKAYPGQAASILGLVGFVGQIPIFLLAPFAGVWVDRWDRHKILLGTQALSMLQSCALAYLALKQIITIPQIFALNAFQGVVNAFDMPARQSFVVEMVDDRKDLPNAIALNSSMVHTARLVGPSVAGFLIYQVGEGFCFLIDAISYLAVLIALLFVHVKPRLTVSHKAALTELQDGLRYAYGFAPIRALLVLIAVVSLMYVSISVLMPIIADKVLGGNERTLGFLLGASGLGALMGSLYLASRASVVGLGRIILRAALALGGSLCVLALSRWFALSMLALWVSGGALVLMMASSNTVLQTIVEDEKRGRVMSLFSLAFMGMAPFGSLLCGGLAAQIGAPETFGVCGCVCLFSALVFARTLPRIGKAIRPIYQQKGILPVE